MTKICIYGAGAIGGHIAGHLAHAGLCDVSIVARGATLAAIRREGLVVETPEGCFTTHPRASDDPAHLGQQDYVLMTVKGHQLDAALPAMEPLIGPDTSLLPPTTGLPAAFLQGEEVIGDRWLTPVDPSGIQRRMMPADQILGMVYWIGAHSVAPGRVQQDGPRATCMVGELNGNSSPRVSLLSDLLTRSGIPTPVRPNIRGDIWVKFVNSLCWNPAAVLTGATNGAIGDDPASITTVRRMISEADAVADRLGLTISVTPEKRIAVTLSAPGHKMSMLQDFEAGRPLELETLERSIRAASELAGMETPVINALLALAALRARTYLREIRP